jgi:hypothetical protein
VTDEATTREQIVARQTDRLPDRATRWALQIHVEQAVDRDALDDALELSSVDILASGRSFEDVPEPERAAILERNLAACVERNRRFLTYLLEEQH